MDGDLSSDTPRDTSGSPIRSRFCSRLHGFCTGPRVGLLIALITLVYSVATIGGHGVTVDEPALNYAGDRTVYWLRHFGAAHTLDLNRLDPPDFHSDFERRPAVDDPLHYPVLPGWIGAMTNWLFHLELGWVDSIDGHHIGLLLMHAVALFLYCAYGARVLGRAPAIAATIALALYPSILGHSFNNAKD